MKLSLTVQDLINIHPALLIAIKSPNTNKQDMRIWLDLVDKIETIAQEAQKEKVQNEV